MGAECRLHEQWAIFWTFFIILQIQIVIAIFGFSRKMHMSTSKSSIGSGGLNNGIVTKSS